MTAIGYIRISTKDQSQYSLPFQESQVRLYAEKNNLNLINVFKDAGESSYTFDRPDWIALEKFIKENKEVGYLVIFDHDRFSRNLAEALMKIKELQDKYKIKVVATTDAFDTDFTDPSTFILRAFKYMMAESELHRIRQRTKNGLYQAALMGRHVNMAPYGYINAKDEQDRGVILIDEQKAYIVRLIFKEYLSGTGIEEIRTVARQHGFKQSGNSAIQDILSNPIYAGLIRVPAFKGEPVKIIKGIHSPVISQQDYWLVQERLHAKTRTVQNREDVPLRGALRCWCGKKVTAGNSKSKSGRYHWYYLCKTHKQNLPAVKLHNQWNEVLQTISLDEQTATLLKEKLEAKLVHYLANRGAEITRIKKELQSLERRISTTEEKYLTQADISKATYTRVISSLRAEEVELNKSLSALNSSKQSYWDQLQQLIPKLQNMVHAFETMDLNKKHQFIDVVFDRSLSHDGETYRTPYIHELFAHKELILKEKGLLIKDQPVVNFAETPLGTKSRNWVEQLEALADLFAA